MKKTLALLFIVITSLFLKNLYAQVKPEQKEYERQNITCSLSSSELCAGETQYFSVWVTDAVSGKLSNFSNVLIAEVLNPAGKVIYTKKLKLLEGRASGFFFFSETTSGGIYRLRLRTVFMQNFSPKFYSISKFRILNTELPFFDYYYLQDLKKQRRKSKKKIFSVHTEYEMLVANKPNFIACSATNSLGETFLISGKIIDSNNKVIHEIDTYKKSLLISFSPKLQNKYTLVLTTKSGKKKQFKLPEVSENIATLIIDDTDESVIEISIDVPNNKSSRDYELKIGKFQKVYYSVDLSFKNTKTIKVGRGQLPNGVLLASLFLKNGGALEAQKNFFLPKETSMSFEPKIYYSKNQLQIKFPSDSIYEGNYSVSVSKVENKESGNYLSSLSSDLENEFFNPVSKENVKYSLQSLDKKEYSYQHKSEHGFKYKNEDRLTVSGLVTKELIKLPYEGARVTLYVLNKHNDRFITHTNKKGEFNFSSLDYSDTIDIVVEARTKRNKKSLIIYPDYLKQTEGIPLVPLNIDSAIRSQRSGRKYHKKNRVSDLEQDSSSFSIPRLHNSADMVISGETLTNGFYSDVSQILQIHLPSGNIRGAGEPLFVIDGTITDRSAANSISVSDIERIEVLKSPGNKAIYGYQGVHGVIAIYTKHGEFNARGEVHFKMLGFSKNKEFEYEVPGIINESITSELLAWLPNIENYNNEDGVVNMMLKNQVKCIEVRIEGVTIRGEKMLYKRIINVKTK